MNTMRFIFVFLTLVSTSLLVPKAFSADNTQPAIQASESWLNLVDSEKYPEAYKGFATFFTERMTEEKWIEQVKSARSIFGKFQSRKLQIATPATSLPGAADGNYVVVQFDTTFEKKKNAFETVTMSLEKTGKWGVVGYYIK